MDLTEKSLINANRCVIAIDPGLSGAVVRLGRGALQVYRDFKVPPEIALTVKSVCSGAVAPDLAVIEAVHAFPGQGVCSVWSFSESTAYAKCALCLCAPPGMTAQEVQPEAWQKFYRLAGLNPPGRDFDARAIALKLFPSYAHLFKRKKDHNSADAVLLGAYALIQRG